jgi:hypothetical protein
MIAPERFELFFGFRKNMRHDDPELMDVAKFSERFNSKVGFKIDPISF